MFSKNLHTSTFLYHCWLWILIGVMVGSNSTLSSPSIQICFCFRFLVFSGVQFIIYNQHFDNITKSFIICSLKLFLSYSTLTYLQYIHITFWDCLHITSARKERTWFWHNLISLKFLIKGGESWISLFLGRCPLSSFKLFFTFTLVLYLE